MTRSDRAAGGGVRKQQLAAIHIRAKQLSLDRDAYEAMLESVAGVKSSRDLDEARRSRVLDHLNEILLSSGPGETVAPRPRSFSSYGRDRGPLLSKIKAMLHARKRPVKYADSIAKRMFDADRLEWCTPGQLRKIVAALSYDQRRHDERHANEP